MAKIKKTKNALKAERESLARFYRFLPTLELKKQQLQIEVRRTRAALAASRAEEAALRAELDGFTRQQPALVPDRTGQVWGDYALVETRERLELGPEPHWLAAFSPQEREEERELGRRLMALMMQHLSAPDDDQALLIEAKSIAVRYAQTCMQVGLTASEGLEATTFFRDALTEVALQMPQVASLDSGARLRLLRKINQVFNVVQLGVVEYFDHHH